MEKCIVVQMALESRARGKLAKTVATMGMDIIIVHAMDVVETEKLETIAVTEAEKELAPIMAM